MGNRQLFFKSIVLLLGLLVAELCQAQCPTAASFTPTVTAATCPSNGSIKLTSAADVPVTGGSGISGTLYQITSGPVTGGYQTTAQSANQFDGLPPGNYTISVTKSGCPTVTVSSTVANQYTPVSLSATVSNVCPGNGVLGATITTSTSGGNLPLTYAFLKTTNANTPDAGLTYGNSSTFQVTAATGGYGTYMVRAKDQCGVFTTAMVDVVPTSPQARYVPNNSIEVNCTTYNVRGSLLDNGVALDPALAPGYQVDIFDVTGTSPSPCAVPAGAAPVKSITINSSSDLNFDFPKAIRKIVIRTTSPCGEVSVNCFNADNDANFNPSTSVSSALSCNVDVGGVNRVNIQIESYRYSYPVQVIIKDHATGAVVLTTSYSSGSLHNYEVDYLAQGYDVTIVDACGQTATKTIVQPGAGTALATQTFTNVLCASVVGAKRVNVFINGANTGLFDAGTTFALVSGPSGPYSPPVAGTKDNNGSIYWNNLTPGTYTGQIIPTTSGCGSTSFTFTVPPNEPGTQGLIFDLNGSVSTLCGGTGTITSLLAYNGNENISFDLLNSAGTVIATNANGKFANLPSGIYTVKAYGVTRCGDAFATTKQYTILPAGSPPVITKKVGITCENGSTQLSTGQALFEFNGVAPFLLEMKPAGTATWITEASGLTTNTYTVSNLNANATYDVRLTDNCGNSTVTTVSIKPLEAQSVTNTVQPCLNQPYTLSAPDFPNATYSWTKNGSVISTSKDIPFASFAASDNGTYVCTLTIGGCVIRTITVTLNSNNCDDPLPVSLLFFRGKALENQVVQLDWATASELNNQYFLIERSKDLQIYETVGKVFPNEEKSVQVDKKYTYTDETPYRGTSYYRLKQVDLDGTVTSYKAISVTLRSDGYGIYPNPVTGGRFTLKLDEPQTAKVILYNVGGQPMSLQKVSNGEGRLELAIGGKTSAGIYVLTVEERGMIRTYSLIVN